MFRSIQVPSKVCFTLRREVCMHQDLSASRQIKRYSHQATIRQTLPHTKRIRDRTTERSPKNYNWKIPQNHKAITCAWVKLEKQNWGALQSKFMGKWGGSGGVMSKSWDLGIIFLSATGDKSRYTLPNQTHTRLGGFSAEGLTYYPDR